MITEICTQGTITPAGTTIYTAPATKIVKFINLTFTNPAAYILTLSRYQKSSNTTIVNYTFTLNAGDYISDKNPYFLKEGDKIIVSCSVPGTLFTAHFFVEDATN